MVTVAPTSPFDVPVFWGGHWGHAGTWQTMQRHVLRTFVPALIPLSVWRCRLCNEPTFLRYIQMLLLFN